MESKVTQLIDRVVTLKGRLDKYSKKKFPLKNHHIKHLLKEIHDQFVATPKDKATGNVTFICKQFYVGILLKELGISKNEQTKCSETYKCHDLMDQELINKHSHYQKNND